MKPSGIFDVLNLAWEAKKNGKMLIPLFSGDAGLGKSQICQQWVAKKKEENPEFGYIDLRLAYLEAPDVIGFPEVTIDKDGSRRTFHQLPNFWPTDGEGLLVFEEPNRSTTGVMNCMMQILTDGKIHNWTLPKGWIIASCVNPDQCEYDVNTMDVALRDRFVEYEIEYDHNTFVDFMESRKYNANVVSFVKSGMWVFKEAKSIGANGKYISPRTWDRVNTAESAGLNGNRQQHFITICSILGKDIGKEYHRFVFDDAPVNYKDILKNKDAAFEKLRKQSDPENYKGDMIAMTVESICKNYSGELEDDEDKEKIGENTMAEVAKIIPSDQSLNMIKTCGLKSSKGNIKEYFKDFTARHPELVDVLKSNVIINRSIDKKKEAKK